METVEKVSHDTTAISENSEIEEIYEQAFPVVAKFIRSAGGSFDDAKDIFHDALVIFLERDSHSTVNIIRSDKAYILGISKHLWFRKQQKSRNNIALHDIENKIPIPTDYLPETNDKRLLNFLELAGKRCMDLLRAFYFQQLSIKEIVKDLGYSNEHSASAQKYKCLEKVRNTVKEKSLTYDTFTE